MSKSSTFINPFNTEKRDELWANRKLNSTPIDKKSLFSELEKASQEIKNKKSKAS